MKLTVITETTMTPGHKTVRYAYDAKRRLQTTSYANGATTSYGYDNRGNRLRRTSRVQGRTSLGYDAFSFSGAMSQSVTHYYHTNHRGDTAYLTGASGVTAASYVYDAFGCLLAQSGIRHPASGICFLFSSKEWDPDAQLYYFGYRWYDPDTGTWTTKDPLRILMGANLFIFCANNALTALDMYGLYPVPYADELQPHFKTVNLAEIDVKPMSSGKFSPGQVRGQAYTTADDPKSIYVNDADHAAIRALTERHKTVRDLRACSAIGLGMLESLIIHELAHLEQFKWFDSASAFNREYRRNKEQYERAADAKAARVVNSII